jgi:multiple sugar transport system permease protein
MTTLRYYWREVTRNRIAYIFLVPAMVSLALVQFLPIAQGVALSFEDYVIYRPQDRPFIGLDNYRRLFQDPLFYKSFWQSWYWTIGSVACQFSLGMAAALVMNQLRRGWFRGVMLIPWVVPGVLAAMMFGLLFTSVGLVNTILYKLGFISQWFPWLSDTRTSMPVLILTNTWKGFPFFAVMLLAAMQAVPTELYEAAWVDGANRWHTFRNITIPGIAPTILVATMLGTIWTFSAIELIYVMTYGGPFYATYILAMFTYIGAFGLGQFSYASAVAVVIALIKVAFTVIYLFIYSRRNQI